MITDTKSAEPRELDLALMMADLCGYTALTETHGALQASETVLRFVRLVEDCLEPGVRIVDSIGDAVFCAGEDALAVANTALALRDAVAREDGFPSVSTGLHSGLVVARAGRLFGAPINLTARLTSWAEGGQILCSERVIAAVPPAAGIEFKPIGMQRFRNVAYPVEVFELHEADQVHLLISIDPVCRMQVSAEHAAAKVRHDSATYLFCSIECARVFSEMPELYAGRSGSARPTKG
jgi:adenylate cyclase